MFPLTNIKNEIKLMWQVAFYCFLYVSSAFPPCHLPWSWHCTEVHMHWPQQAYSSLRSHSWAQMLCFPLKLKPFDTCLIIIVFWSPQRRSQQLLEAALNHDFYLHRESGVQEKGRVMLILLPVVCILLSQEHSNHYISSVWSFLS